MKAWLKSCSRTWARASRRVPAATREFSKWNRVRAIPPIWRSMQLVESKPVAAEKNDDTKAAKAPKASKVPKAAPKKTKKAASR